jgi:steroid delta-isomerase-like uncharacterized protein
VNKYRVLLLAAAVGAVVALAAALVPANARAQKKGDLIDDWVAAWNSHDADAVAALFTADGVYEDVPTGTVNNGQDEIRAFAQFSFDAVPDLHVELVNGNLKGGHGTIEWVYSGTDVGLFGTGGMFSVRGVTVLDVHGQKITRNSDYWDLATVLRELGLL